jgi:hypothetical protein
MKNDVQSRTLETVKAETSSLKQQLAESKSTLAQMQQQLEGCRASTPTRSQSKGKKR